MLSLQSLAIQLRVLILAFNKASLLSQFVIREAMAPLPIENRNTPSTWRMQLMTLSTELYAWRSPQPTVTRVVTVQQNDVMQMSQGCAS
ncbi:hypothetical protein FGO68_gene4314 [Halteria grandinella]|uniref:Secreted protein n=1 Tax=Halteria grandinella TaxID=5974 RepID=A0A8J8P0G0_HALGN|nr:hypothetical protein FGO68_gene4314 [Halteria grandinella]